MGGQGTKQRRNIAKNFNRLSSAHERYRRQTDNRRQRDRRWHNSRSLKNKRQPSYFVFSPQNRPTPFSLLCAVIISFPFARWRHLFHWLYMIARPSKQQLNSCNHCYMKVSYTSVRCWHTAGSILVLRCCCPPHVTSKCVCSLKHGSSNTSPVAFRWKLQLLNYLLVPQAQITLATRLYSVILFLRVSTLSR